MRKSALFGAVSLCVLFACQNTDKSATAENDESTSAMKNSEKGYQLYTVREALTGADSIAATLEATRAMGYEKVESFGYMDGGFLGLTTLAFNKAIADADLTAAEGEVKEQIELFDKFAAMTKSPTIKGQQWTLKTVLQSYTTAQKIWNKNS